MMTTQAEIVLEKLGIAERPWTGGQYHTQCPAHDDQKASLSVLVDEHNITLQCHAGCSYEDILEAADLTRADMILEPEGITIETLAEHKRLPASFLERLGLETVGNEVRIPYRKHNGELASRHRRRLGLRASGGGSRWTDAPGSPICYGEWRLKGDKSTEQVFVEGESDCWTLWYHNLPAIGIPGATHAKKITLRHLRGKERVYIWQEPDAAGQRFVRDAVNRLHHLGWTGQVYSIRSLDGEKDPNEVHQRTHDFPAKWKEILAEAKPEELSFRRMAQGETGEEARTERHRIELANGCYRKRVFDKHTEAWIWTTLSDFWLEIEEVRVTEEQATQWAVRIHGANLRQPARAVLESRDLSGKPALLRWLPQGLTWYGSNQDIDHLRNYLGRKAKDAPTKKALTRWGRHGSVVVYPGMVLDADGIVEEPEVVLQSRGHEGWLREPENVEWNPEEAARIVGSLTQFNRPEVVALALGWTFATPWRQEFRQFPQFSFASGSGSGKTTTAVLMANLGGNAIRETASAQQSKFMLTRQMASTTTLPITLDEFKPGEMKDWTLRDIQELLRLNYDCSFTGRGRADQSVIDYQLTAPVILLGEGSVEQTALIDRAVRPSMSRRQLEESPGYQAAYHRLSQSNLGMFSLAYQMWALAQEADLTPIELPVGASSPRAAHNHKVVKFGWMMLGKFCREMVGAELPELDIDGAITRSMENLGYVETVDGQLRQRGTRSDVDILMQAIHDATVNGHLVPGVHWVRRAREGDVVIRLSSTLDRLKNAGARVLSTADYRRIVQMGDCAYAVWDRSKQAEFRRTVDSRETVRTRGPLVVDPDKMEDETGIPAAFWQMKDASDWDERAEITANRAERANLEPLRREQLSLHKGRKQG